MDLVLDIETIPEREDIIEKYCRSFPNKRKKEKPFALHPCTCQVVVIGMKPIGCKPVIFVGEEIDILVKAREYIKNANPTRLVTFNGVGFDFPVLRWRAARNNIQGLGRLLPGNRDPRCYDIYQKIRWELPMSLSEISMLLFGDPKEKDGSTVEKLYKENKIDELINYNATDLEITEGVYLWKTDLFPS